MKQNLLKLPYLLSAVVLLACVIISAFTGWSTENTLFGMLSFIFACLPSLIVSICNANVCRKQGLGLRILFYVLILVLGAWVLFGTLFSIFALKNGLITLV